MFNLNQLVIDPVSGFIALDPAVSPVDPKASPESNASPPEAGAARIGWAGHVEARTTWQSPVGNSVRKVEIAILASICGYFAFGLGSSLGLY